MDLGRDTVTLTRLMKMNEKGMRGKKGKHEMRKRERQKWEDDRGKGECERGRGGRGEGAETEKGGK